MNIALKVAAYWTSAGSPARDPDETGVLTEACIEVLANHNIPISNFQRFREFGRNWGYSYFIAPFPSGSPAGDPEGVDNKEFFRII